MPSGTPALAHACAQPLWAAPDAPFVVKQFRSTTWPVSVISLPGVAACPCAASGSAQQASTAVVAMIRFNIVRSSCSEYTERKTPHVRGRPAVVSRVPYVPTGGSRLGYIGRHERRLSSTPGDVWPGWGAGDVDTILSVFAPDAVFLETPFSEQSVGSDAIRAYWKDIPTNQADVTFKSGEIYAAGPWFATEFRCTYRRRRTGEWVDARGAMFCETKDGKITEMRMYWHRYP